MLISNIEEIKKTNLILIIFCDESHKNFSSCFLKINITDKMRIKSSEIMLLCSNETLTCPLIKSFEKMTIEKFLGKCYFIFNFIEQKLNYDEIRNYCLKKNLQILTISTIEQARFLFNKILIKKLQDIEKSEKKENLLIKDIEKEIFLPLSKIYVEF